MTDWPKDEEGVLFFRTQQVAEAARRDRLDGGKLASPCDYGGIAKDRRSRHMGRYLSKQLQPFSAQVVFESHETGGVAARPRQAVDKAGSDRIASDREHDRYGAGHLQQRRHGRGTMGQDHVRRQRD